MRSGCLSGDGRDGENTDVGILLWKVVVNVERELENVRNSTWYSRQRTVWQCCKDYCTRTRQVWRHGVVVVTTNNTKHIMQSEIRRTWGKSNVKISERQHWKFYFDDFKTGVTSVLEIRINTRSIKLLPRIRVKNSEELSEDAFFSLTERYWKQGVLWEMCTCDCTLKFPMHSNFTLYFLLLAIATKTVKFLLSEGYWENFSEMQVHYLAVTREIIPLTNLKSRFHLMGWDFSFCKFPSLFLVIPSGKFKRKQIGYNRDWVLFITF